MASARPAVPPQLGVRLTRNAAVGALPGVAFLLRAVAEFLIAPAKSSLPPGRRLAGYALAAVLAVVFAILRGQLNLTTEVLAVLVAVIAVALLGGLAPAAREPGGRRKSPGRVTPAHPAGREPWCSRKTRRSAGRTECRR
jgi:hypothetical protein